MLHIEAPKERVFTLGDFFDMWGQPLGADQVGPRTGAVSAYVNGVVYDGDVRGLSLEAHGVVQLNVGTHVEPQPFTFGPRTIKRRSSALSTSELGHPFHSEHRGVLAHPGFAWVAVALANEKKSVE